MNMQKVKLKDIAKVSAGQPAPKELGYDINGHPFIRAGSLEGLLDGESITNLEKVSEEVAKKNNLKLYWPETVIFAKSGMSATKNRIYMLENLSYVVSHLAVLEPFNVDPKYLVYALRHFSPIRLIKDMAYPSISLKSIENHVILIPEKEDDQIRIANLLSHVESLITKRQEGILLLDELLKSTFLHMFGDPVINTKQWELVPLSQLGELNRGISKHRPRNAPELLGGKYPLIQTGDVSNADLYLESYTQTYSEFGLAQSKLWPKNTLCITIAANIAKTAILNFEACFPDSVVGMEINKDETNLFYVHYLFKFFQKLLEKNAPKAAQKNINLQILRSLKVPKADKKLQDKFATIVQKVEKTKALYQSSLDELKKLFGSLSQQAFEGELDLKLKAHEFVEIEKRDTQKSIVSETAIIKSIEPEKIDKIQSEVNTKKDISKQFNFVDDLVKPSLFGLASGVAAGYVADLLTDKKAKTKANELDEGLSSKVHDEVSKFDSQILEGDVIVKSYELDEEGLTELIKSMTQEGSAFDDIAHQLLGKGYMIPYDEDFDNPGNTLGIKEIVFKLLKSGELFQEFDEHDKKIVLKSAT